jgi:signal peptidase II
MKAVPANRYVSFFAIAAIGCAVDLATKTWIFDKLGMPDENAPIQVVDEIFMLETRLNEGALFGMGQGFAHLFAALALAACVGILVWLFVAGGARDWLLTIALALISGGMVGNLYDRLGWHGLKWHEYQMDHAVGEPVFAVRDWLHFKIDAIQFDWAVFNIADSMLVCGSAMLVWHSLFSSAHSSESAPSSSAKSLTPPAKASEIGD